MLHVRVLQSCVGFTPKCLFQVLLAASNLCVLIITLRVRLSPVIEAGGYYPRCRSRWFHTDSALEFHLGVRCRWLLSLCVRDRSALWGRDRLLTVLLVEVLQANVGCIAMFFCCKSSPVLEAGGFNTYTVLGVIPGVRSRWPLQRMCVHPSVAQYALHMWVISVACMHPWC